MNIVIEQENYNTQNSEGYNAPFNVIMVSVVNPFKSSFLT
jgi:hypothetical protein